MRQFLTALCGAFLFAVPGFADPGAMQPSVDNDTLCAAIYTYAAAAAGEYGMASDGFEASALLAKRVHMAANPGEDWQGYSLSVIAAANSIVDGLARRTITSDFVMTTAANCNARYNTISVQSERGQAPNGQRASPRQP